MSEWSILGPLVLGVIIGFIELVFVHMDESGMGWLGHGLHAIPFIVILLFISMNISWALSLVNITSLNIGIIIGVRILLGLIATVKIKTAAAVVGKAGEKTYHALIIGALIAVAPYIWEYIFTPLIEGLNLPIQ